MKLLLLILTLLIIFNASAQLCKAQNNICNIESMERADKALLDVDTSNSISTHCPFGMPQLNEAIEVLYQDDYIMGFHKEFQNPVWVAYLLTKERASTSATRSDCFRPDPRLEGKDYSPSCESYEGSGYDRGHLAPRNDFNNNTASMHNTYILTNMSPQEPNFNRTTWRGVEASVNKFAENKDSVYVLTGAIFDYDGDNKIDTKKSDIMFTKKDKRIGVPTHFYKILVHKTEDGTYESLTLILPHDNISRKKAPRNEWLENKCISSIDSVESVLGVDFFPELTQQGLESVISPKLWW